jgi:kinesin family protein 2/24
MTTKQIKIKSVQDDIDNLKKRREERKAKENRKIASFNNNQESIGRMMDKDYERMIRMKKANIYSSEPEPHTSIGNSKIFVIVRKRPLSKKEINNGEIDCISCLNPKVVIHECKIKIDGITKYLEDYDFYFDNTFSENESTEEIYGYTIEPMINLVLKKGIVTCFAYGQTGSGKTYTMKGIQNLAIESLYEESQKIKKKFEFYISFFEIYGGRLYDLLNNKNKLQVFDDSKGITQIYGLQEILAETKEDMKLIIEKANSIRTTHNTVTNETSSRSHAICNIVIKEKGSKEFGKLSLVDLAGSERAEETQSNNRTRRAEGAEINKSLLALKECIRALQARKTSGNNDIHVPFRASKLTHVLRDSFVSKSDKSRIIMISCINPSYIFSNHSINTLRYSDRLKEQTAFVLKQIANNNNNKIKNNNNQGNNEQKHQNNKNNSSNNLNSININLNNKQKKELEREKELEEINMNVFNVKDDILNDINFDERINLDDDLLEFQKIENKSNKNENIKETNNEIEKENTNIITPQKNINIDNNSEKIIDEEMDDLIYLKKTVSKDGKFISDDFIKYHKLTDTIIQDEDDIITTHMEVVKQDAKLLTEEGRLISLIKGIGSEEEKIEIDEYIQRLENILDQKMNIYSGLEDKIDVYKGHLKEEDRMRKEHPQFFVDPADL